jgi:hypothetical protein
MKLLILFLAAVFLVILFGCNGRLIQNEKGQIMCYTNEDQPSSWSREHIRHVPAEYER